MSPKIFGCGNSSHLRPPHGPLPLLERPPVVGAVGPDGRPQLQSSPGGQGASQGRVRQGPSGAAAPPPGDALAAGAAGWDTPGDAAGPGGRAGRAGRTLLILGHGSFFFFLLHRHTHTHTRSSALTAAADQHHSSLPPPPLPGLPPFRIEAPPPHPTPKSAIRADLPGSFLGVPSFSGSGLAFFCNLLPPPFPIPSFLPPSLFFVSPPSSTPPPSLPFLSSTLLASPPSPPSPPPPPLHPLPLLLLPRCWQQWPQQLCKRATNVVQKVQTDFRGGGSLL